MTLKLNNQEKCFKLLKKHYKKIKREYLKFNNKVFAEAKDFSQDVQYVNGGTWNAMGIYICDKKLQDEKSKISIQRFKGLGEMNPDELWNTTLNPETRTLLKVEYSKDLKKDIDLIHTLMGNDVSLRKDFIVNNAINVSNLDI